MSERYTRLYSLPNNLYLDGAPALIVAGALLKDNETGKVLAQLKLQNLAESRLVACKVTVQAFDIAGAELSGIENYAYLDISVSRGENFGAKEPITLPDSATRKIIVSIIQVVFENGEIWQDSIGVWTSIASHQLITDRLEDTELQKQYSIEVNGNCEYAPQKTGDLFLCACGTVNLSEYKICSGCKRNIADLLSALDIGELTLKKDLRLQHEREQAAEEERIAEEKKRVAEIARINAKKKEKRILTIAAMVALTVAVIVLAVKFIVIPETKYRDAVKLLEAKDYNEAKEIFVQLGTYRDSPERISKDIPYLKACDNLNNGDYEKAMKEFLDVGDYKDSANLLLEAQEGCYLKALTLLEKSDLEGAYSIFNSIQSYKDSEQNMQTFKDTVYADAISKFQAGKYEDALKRFDFLHSKYPNWESSTINDYWRFCEVKCIDFNNGELHRLDEPYSKVISISDASLKNQLMSIPQMEMVSKLEGKWYHHRDWNTMDIKGGTIAIEDDLFILNRVLCFENGKYGYRGSGSPDGLWGVITNVSVTSFTVVEWGNDYSETYTRQR